MVAALLVGAGPVGVWLPSTASAAPPASNSVDDAVSRLIDARTRANTVADQIATTEADIEWLESGVAHTQNQIAKRRSDIGTLRAELFENEAAPRVSPLLQTVRSLGLQRLSTELVALELRETELATKEAELADRRERLAEQQRAVAAEVADLRGLEQQYLDDAAVRSALAAKLAAANQRQAESERRAALAAQTELVSATDGDQTELAGRTPIAGRTGAGGNGSEPVAVIPEVGIMCPVVGGSAYSNSWGAPRSGGRSHEGVDMLAPIGTPLRAVIGGVARHRNNRLGGTTVSLVGDDGNRYYYAHLSAYEGGGGRVEPGEIIGYIGKTGAANGVPHLHFEIHPGGGRAVNPYSTVVAAGC